MSALASFVLECVKSGRWARGLLALQSCRQHPDPALRHARVRLAAVAATHHWHSALSLLQVGDVRAEWHTVCRVLDAVSRQATQPREVYLQTVSALLRGSAHDAVAGAAHPSAEVQNALFLSATRWASWREAQWLFYQLQSPHPTAQARLDELARLRRSLAPVTRALSRTPPLTNDGDDRPEHDAHYTRRGVESDVQERWRRRCRTAREAQEQRTALRAALQPFPTATDLAHLLRAATRWPVTPNVTASTLDHATLLAVSPRTALTLLARQHLTEELAWLYARCVGVAAPWLWRQAIERLRCAAAVGASEVDPVLQTWLTSRGSWGASVVLMHELRTGAARLEARVEDMVYDFLSRSAMPRRELHRLFPCGTRPTVRLPRLTRRAVADVLARGVRLEEVQLSALVRRWARTGRWEAVLQVYARRPTNEFQRYAVQALLALRTADATPLAADAILRRLVQCSSRTPPSTFCMCALLPRAEGWCEGLRVFRACVQRGGRCNPQVMSALMNLNLPQHELDRLLRAYPAAVNAGVRRRAQTLLGA